MKHEARLLLNRAFQNVVVSFCTDSTIYKLSSLVHQPSVLFQIWLEKVLSFATERS